MAQDVLTPPAPLAASTPDDSLGIDREFLVKLSRMPLFALLWVGPPSPAMRSLRPEESTTGHSSSSASACSPPSRRLGPEGAELTCR